MSSSDPQYFIDRSFDFFFNDTVKKRFEDVILYIASIGFIIHLGIIFLFDLGYFELHPQIGPLVSSPVAAIYTPFSFILVYEVYLLIYYLPRSFSISIAKQFEVISLILIRRIFKDISMMDLEESSLFAMENIDLVYDIVGFILLFVVIYLFRRLLVKRKKHTITKNIENFILYKKLLCCFLVPLFIGLSIYSFGNWVIELNQLNAGIITEIKDFNKIFYNEFFTALVLVDMLILIASFHYTDRYSLLIRNTGFVVTTVLIRVSFSTEGLSNITLILAGAIFGLIILYLYSLYDVIDKGESTRESYAYL